jgi:hypothetical protein
VQEMQTLTLHKSATGKRLPCSYVRRDEDSRISYLSQWKIRKASSILNNFK